MYEVADLGDESTFGQTVITVQAAAMSHPVGDALERSFNPHGLFLGFRFYRPLALNLCASCGRTIRLSIRWLPSRGCADLFALWQP